MAWADDFTWVEEITTLGPTSLNKVNKALRELKGLTFNVMDYGAVGDGVTDDTTAIQSCVNDATAASGCVLFPNGTYKITAAITILASNGWTIRGESLGATIQQATDNTPILQFTGNFTHTWAIRNLSLTYAVDQPSTNTSAVPIQFVGSVGVKYDYYNGLIDHIYFARGCDCIAHDAATNVAAWGIAFRNLTVSSAVSRSVVRLKDLGGNGTPNNRFDHIYVRADSMVGPLFTFTGGENTEFHNIEINQALLGPTMLWDWADGSYSIGAWKVEVGTYDGTNPMFMLANSKVMIDFFKLVTISLSNTGGSETKIFRLDGGGDGNQVRLRTLYVGPGCTVSAGTWYVLGSNSGSGYVTIDSIPLGLPTSFVLSDVWGSTAPEIIRVMDWNNDRVSSDKGDADYTVTIGDPNVISYETALTAARTVTLPHSFAPNNCFNGLYYRVCRSGGGAFDLKIVDANGSTLLDSIVSGKTGAIEYTYRRGKWVQTLKAVA